MLILILALLIVLVELYETKKMIKEGNEIIFEQRENINYLVHKVMDVYFEEPIPVELIENIGNNYVETKRVKMKINYDYLNNEGDEK